MAELKNLTVAVGARAFEFRPEDEWWLKKLHEAVEEKSFGKIELDLKNGTIHNLQKRQSFVAPENKKSRFSS